MFPFARYSEYIDTDKNQILLMQENDSNEVLFILEGEHGKLEITSYAKKDWESKSIIIRQAY